MIYNRTEWKTNHKNIVSLKPWENSRVCSEFDIWLDLTQWAKSPKKQSERVRFCKNSTFKIQRHVVKNSLLQTAFLAILPTRMVWYLVKSYKWNTRVYLFHAHSNSTPITPFWRAGGFCMYSYKFSFSFSLLQL